jgi:hypothetical protein
MSDDYTGILLEEIRSQNQAVLEAVGQIQDTVKTLATQDSVDQVAATVATIQAAVTANNTDIVSLKGRVTRLEQTTP